MDVSDENLRARTPSSTSERSRRGQAVDRLNKVDPTPRRTPFTPAGRFAIARISPIAGDVRCLSAEAGTKTSSVETVLSEQMVEADG